MGTPKAHNRRSNQFLKALRDEKETPWKANDQVRVIWRSRGNKERRIGEYTKQYSIPFINISIITGKSRGYHEVRAKCFDP
jgi:hypothetical protein